MNPINNGLVQTRLPLEERVNILISQCNQTVNKIAQAVLMAIIEGSQMNAPSFAAKHITVTGQNEIAVLDQNTHVLVKNLLFEVIQKLAQVPSVLQGLTMLSMLSGDGKFTEKFLKEKALPEVKNLVTNLNAIDPSIVEEATSTGVDPVADQLLKQLNID